MINVFKKIWPLLIGLTLLIGVSYLAQTHYDQMRALLNQNASSTNMLLYVGIGIATVIIPFGSLIPFIPIAVLLWGWPTTAILTLVAWVLGAQLLFEFSRFVGKPFMMKIIPTSQLDTIATLVQGDGLLHAIFIRMVVHADIVSYAFGMFTDINRWKFLLVTIIGVGPGAVLYAYFGSLPIVYQIGMALAGIIAFAVYWSIGERRERIAELMQSRLARKNTPARSMILR